MIKVLTKNNSVANTFLAELRDENVQKDSMRFRKNLERLGEIFAYEISKDLPYEQQEITTPLGISKMQVPSCQPVVATILRAGLGFHQGFLNFFDAGQSAFVSAYRKTEKSGALEIQLDYISAPDLDGRVLIVADPMLATGRSVEVAMKALLRYGNPSQIHVASVIASPEGINWLKKVLPADTKIWTAAIDDELTAQAYIVPGLGDAGDLAYGAKLSY